MADIVFVTPPFTANFYPQLAASLLTACVRQAGLRAEQADLNQPFHQHLDAALKLKALVNPGQQSQLGLVRGALLMHFSNQLFRQQGAQRRYFSPYLRPEGERSEHLNQDLAFGYGCTGLLRAPPELMARFAEDEECNPHAAFLARTGLDQAVLQHARLVGLSLITPSQFIPALTLAARLKRMDPRLRVVLGGAWASMFVCELVSTPALSCFYDAVVQGEGEAAAVHLAGARDAEAWAAAPNTWVKAPDGSFKPPRRWVQADMNELPTPDFDGLPLDAYTTPRPVNLQTARGCYWNRCSFCVHTFANKRFKPRRFELVQRDIESLVARYDPRCVIFADLAHPVARLDRMSRWFTERGFRFRWLGFVRFERSLNFEVLCRMRDAGCDRIMFGLESVDPCTLSTIRKGHDRATVERILDDCQRLGIRPVVTTMIGLPGETRQQAMQTIDFLRQRAEQLQEAFVDVFRLERDTAIFDHPEQFGISIDKEAIPPFDNAIRFRNVAGALQSDQALELANHTIYAHYAENPGMLWRRKSIRCLTDAQAFDRPSRFAARCDLDFGALRYQERLEVEHSGWDFLHPASPA